jgi:hypothetical protein
MINVTVMNFSPYVYYGQLVVEGEASSVTVNDTIDLIINVSPEIYTKDMRHIVDHNTTTNNGFIINSTGNARLTSVSITESGFGCQFMSYNPTVGDIVEQQYANVSITVTIPEHYDPGNY